MFLLLLFFSSYQLITVNSTFLRSLEQHNNNKVLPNMLNRIGLHHRQHLVAVDNSPHYYYTLAAVVDSNLHLCFWF
ncbi:hypothetical protein BDC45DRAFT_526816 [Circinella umbellata]|nr:hypothetical protein BDC45DRAFT_526816 [Circinella umbellata]